MTADGILQLPSTGTSCMMSRPFYTPSCQLAQPWPGTLTEVHEKVVDGLLRHDAVRASLQAAAFVLNYVIDPHVSASLTEPFNQQYVLSSQKG